MKSTVHFKVTFSGAHSLAGMTLAQKLTYPSSKGAYGFAEKMEGKTIKEGRNGFKTFTDCKVLLGG